MSQIFHPATNSFAKATIYGAVFIVAGLAVVWGVFLRSSYVRGTNVAPEQPLPFSHEHHVSGLASTAATATHRWKSPAWPGCLLPTPA